MSRNHPSHSFSQCHARLSRNATQAFAAHIKEVGTAMVNDLERDRVLVQDLLDFKERLDRVLTISFCGSEHFGHALKEAFESFINVRQVRTLHRSKRLQPPDLHVGLLAYGKAPLGPAAHPPPFACGDRTDRPSWWRTFSTRSCDRATRAPLRRSWRRLSIRP